MLTTRFRQIVLLLIPVLYLAWSLQLNLLGGPFSLSRSDPEYPYLLNGLNCATLDFNNIGHTDHPGTPFQMITGLFIRVTHVFIGQEPLVQDVLSRPETYLACASLFLSFLTFLLLYWLGDIAIRHEGKLTGAIILQASILLSTVLLEMPIRYSPDRMLVIYNIAFAGFTIKYLLSKNYPIRLYAIISGILMGVGVATKFNFLPVLIIPLLLIPDFRNRLIYGFTIAASFFISVLPILSKFKEFRQFISGVASHDGLYGHGSQQMINWKSFSHNFWELLSYNPAFSIILIISIGLILFYFLDKKKFNADDRLLLVLKAFVLASFVGFILVSKHFKVYYFAPVLSLCGLVLFMIWKISGVQMKSKKTHTISTIALLIILVVISVIPLPAQYRSRIAQKRANLKTQQFFAENVTRKDLLFIEPTWLAGPMVENALMYGISYVAHRQEFYLDYKQIYPHVITWEGTGKNPGLSRTAEADPESILFSGRDIFIYSSPGRNASVLLNFLDTLAGRFGTWVSRDTVFSNLENEDRVIRVRNIDGWSTLLDIKKITDPAELSPANPISQAIPITGVTAGDYLEITIRISGNDNDARGRIIARSVQSDQDGIYFEDSGSLQDIGHGWQLLRLRGKLNSTPADGKMVCQVYYPGNKTITVQDLQIRHMGRR
ncbi:MAG: hypothetical protein D4R64_11425 [Porphyromonadaceae bacterium]|nr:MAG: hypothetical protein D4R64_11425 [Porphyromonadaceae bacterium]